MGLPLKLNLEDADVMIGGITVNSCNTLSWNISVKTADTILRGNIVSTAHSQEQIKGSISIEQWQAGELEKELRNGKSTGSLAGLIVSIVVQDSEGRYFKSPMNRIEKGSVKWDSKVDDDYVALEFSVLDMENFEASIHGGSSSAN